MATLEASIQHISDLAEQYEQLAKKRQQQGRRQVPDDDGDDVFEYFDERLLP